MKKSQFLWVLSFSLILISGGIFYAIAGSGSVYESPHFTLESSRLERVQKENEQVPFFVSPSTLPSFSIQKGEKKIEKLNICRIDLKNPGKWSTLGISNLDTTNPEEVKRWVDHNAEYNISASFTDVSVNYYAQSIGRLQKEGIIKGYADGTFQPFQNVSRAELLKIITEGTPALLEEEQKSKNQNCFEDTKGHWSEQYVCFAKEKGYIKGKNDGNFHPNDPVSYAEALKILYVLQNDTDAKEALGEYWFQPFTDDANSRNLVPPDVWDPQAYLNRAQIAELFVRYGDAKHPEQKVAFFKKFPASGAEEALQKIPELSVQKSDFSAKDCAEFVTVEVPMDLKNSKTVFDMNTVKGKLKNVFGLFAVYLDDTEEMQFSTRYFSVMNAGILLKKSSANTFAWVFDPATGIPLKNAKIYGKSISFEDSFWNASDEGMSGGRWGLPYFSGQQYETGDQKDKKYQLKKNIVSYLSPASKNAILLGTTNESGILQIPAESILKGKTVVDPNFFIIEQENAWGVHLESWKESMNPRWFPDQWDNSDWESSIVGHIYTDRTMFRPGHTVHFKGVMFQRDVKDLGLKNIPEGLSVRVRLQKMYDDTSDPLAETIVKISKNSSFSGEFVIPENAELGDFQIYVTAPKGYDKNYNVWTGIMNTVRIEEYRRPTFYLNLSPEKHEYFMGETANITALSARYAGGGIGGGTMSYTVTARPVYETDLENGNDGFQEEGVCVGYCEYGYFEVTRGETPLDTEGNGKISIPLQFGSDIQTNLVFIVEATVKDARGEEATEISSIIVYRQKDTGEVRPALKITDRVQKIGVPFNIQLQSKNYQLKTVGNKTLRMVLQKVEEKCATVKDVTRGERKDCAESLKIIEEKTLNTHESGNLLYRPTILEGGKYIFSVTGGDKIPYYPSAETSINVTPATGEVSRYDVPNALTETLWVIPGQGQIGVDTDQETSHQIELALQKDSFQAGETAKLVITSPFPKAKALVTIEGKEVYKTAVLDIVGNLGVYEFPVTKEMAPNIQTSVFLVEMGTDTPRFKIGYTDLNLSLDEQELSVIVTPEKQEYKTGEDITLSVKTTNKQGKPIPAEVSVGVVDEALVRMAGQVDTNFLLRIFPRRWITLTSSTNLLAFLHDNFFSSFGGAGKGGVSKNMPEVRKDFKEVLYWNPTVQTDSHGNAKISFPSGESLTSYIILSAGFSTDNSHQFGSGEGKVSVSKDFVLQPDLPRFVREGDKLSLSTRVVNITNASQTVEVSLTAPLLGKSFSPVAVSLNTGESKTVSFPVTVPDKSEGKEVLVTFVAKSSEGSVGDSVQIAVPVKTHGQRTLSQQNMVLLDGTVKIPFENILPENFESLTVNITNSPLSDLKSRALQLLSYPYGCAEQTTSTTMPNAIVASLQKEIGESPALAERNIIAGFARLKKFQRPDGGFSLWENEESSNPSVSATVGGGLAFMKQSGYSAPVSLLNPFKEYLKTQVSENNTLSRTVKIRLLYVGITLGAFDEDQARSYVKGWYDQWKDLTGFEKTDLALAFAKVSFLTDTDKKKIADEILAIPSFSDAIQGIGESESPHYFDGSESFFARQVRVVIALDSNRENLSALVVKALNGENNGNYFYFSSYSEAEKLLTAYEYSVKSVKRGAGDVSVVFGGKTSTVNFSSEKAGNQLFSYISKNASLTPLTVTNIGKGPLYFSSKITFIAPPEKLAKSNGGMRISRNILDAKGKMISKNEKIKFGSTYQIKVSFTAPSSSRSLAVSVPIPAGFEIVTDYTADKNYNFQHIEHRDDRVDIFPYDEQKSGEYIFKVRPIADGIYRFPPSTAVAMYDAKSFASTDGMILTIE